MTAIIGVDPGYKQTGLVLRDGEEYLQHVVVTKPEEEDLLEGVGASRYLQAVKEAIRALKFWPAIHGDGDQVWVSIESVRRPKSFIGGKQRITDPTPIIGTGVVFGAVRALYPNAIVVADRQNGQRLLAHYPTELITPGERRHGLNRTAPDSSSLRHCRSAWDVAGHGLTYIKVRGLRFPS